MESGCWGRKIGLGSVGPGIRSVVRVETIFRRNVSRLGSVNKILSLYGRPLLCHKEQVKGCLKLCLYDIRASTNESTVWLDLDQ